MIFRSKALAGLLGLTVAVGTVGVMAIPSANAATAACGAGFRQVDSIPLKSAAGKAGPANLVVYWSTATQQNCALTVHTGAAVGKAYSTTAKIKASSSTGWKKDKGSYKSYAGPVTVVSPGCTDVYGNIVVDNVVYTAVKLHGYCQADPKPVAAPPAPSTRTVSNSGGGSRGYSAPTSSSRGASAPAAVESNAANQAQARNEAAQASAAMARQQAEANAAAQEAAARAQAQSQAAKNNAEEAAMNRRAPDPAPAPTPAPSNPTSIRNVMAPR